MSWSPNEPDLDRTHPDLITTRDLVELSPSSLVAFAGRCLQRAMEFATRTRGSTTDNLSSIISDAVSAALRLTGGPFHASEASVVRENAVKAAEFIVHKSATDDRHEDSYYQDTAPDEDEAYRTVAAAAYVAASVATAVELTSQLKSPLLPVAEAAQRLYATSLHFAGSMYYSKEDFRKALEIYGPETLKNIRHDLESIRSVAMGGNEVSLFCGLQVKEINDALYLYLCKNPQRIHELSPRKFEELIADILKDMGYEVELTPQTRDGGRDVLAKVNTPIGKMLLIVECKKYRPDRKLGIDIVERFLYVIERKDNASCGLIATTSFFSLDVRRVARQLEYRLKLRDFDGIKEWIGQHGKWRRDGQSMLWRPALPDRPLRKG